MSDPKPSKPDAVPPILVTRAEAARILGIGERTLWRLTDMGDIPCRRIGRAVRYRVVDLESYAARLPQR